MAVRIWPEQLKHLDQWLNAVVPGLPSNVDLPWLILRLTDHMEPRRRLVVRADDRAKGGFRPALVCTERMTRIIGTNATHRDADR
jgi:hypothetical protein